MNSIMTFPSEKLNQSERKQLCKRYRHDKNGMRTFMENMLLMRDTRCIGINDNHEDNCLVLGEHLPPLSPDICLGVSRMKLLLDYLFDVSTSKEGQPQRVGVDQTNVLVEGGDASDLVFYFSKRSVNVEPVWYGVVQNKETLAFIAIPLGHIVFFGDKETNTMEGNCECFYGFPGLIYSFRFNMATMISRYKFFSIFLKLDTSDAGFERIMDALRTSFIERIGNDVAWRNLFIYSDNHPQCKTINMHCDGMNLYVDADQEKGWVSFNGFGIQHFDVCNESILKFAEAYVDVLKECRLADAAAMEAEKKDMLDIDLRISRIVDNLRNTTNLLFRDDFRNAIELLEKERVAKKTKIEEMAAALNVQHLDEMKKTMNINAFRLLYVEQDPSPVIVTKKAKLQ